MSALFRMLLVNRASHYRAMSSIYLRFNVHPPKLSLLSRECQCKTFIIRSSLSCYSTQVETKSSSSDRSSVSNDHENEVIYTGLLARNIRNIKLLSLSTTLIGLGVQPVVYQKAVLAGTTNALTLPVFALIGLFAIATPPLLHIITKRYVLSVEYNPVKDTYTATTYNLFCMQKKVEFTPEDVTIPTVLGMFTTCAIKGKPVFLDAENFKDQTHYVRIMGYDKPLDLQVDDNSDENCSKKK